MVRKVSDRVDGGRRKTVARSTSSHSGKISQLLVVGADMDTQLLLELMAAQVPGRAVRARGRAQALEICRADAPHVAFICSGRLDALTALSLVTEIKAINAGTQVFLLGKWDVREAAQGLGGELLEAVDDNFLERTIAACEAARASLEDRSATARRFQIVGEHPTIRQLRQDIATVASSKLSVLVRGETGTGKELVAQSIHAQSGRPGALVDVNCAAIPSELLESELFGHTRGAFTGAAQDRDGLVGAAERGTLLLDEIGDMPYGLQAKLLRLLQEKQYRRVGGNQLIAADVRFVSTTNVDFERQMLLGRFREDLYYRISALTVRIPPLRERKEDIPILCDHFLAQLATQYGQDKPKVMSTDALDALAQSNWPGNVRQLEHAIDRGFLRAGNREEIQRHDVSFD